MMVVRVALILSIFGSVMSSMIISEKDLDKLSRPVLGFGDPDNPLVYKAAQLKAVCMAHKYGASESTKNILFGIYNRSASVSKFVDTIYRPEVVYTEMCKQVIEGQINDFTHFKAVHDSNQDMIPAREAFTRTMIAAAQKTSTFTYNDLLCFIDLWIKSTLDVLKSEQAKEIVANFLKPISTYVSENTAANQTLACEWPNTPALEKNHLYCPPLLFIRALNNLDSKNTPAT